jgi:cysteine sulfinate desulfinase/cysteine desulfurase-like protein
MVPFLLNKFGNPHSGTHEYGLSASEAVEEGRKVDNHKRLDNIR